MRIVTDILWIVAITLPLCMVLVPAEGMPAGETVAQWVWLGKVWPWSAMCAVTAYGWQMWSRRGEKWKERWKVESFPLYVTWSLILLGGIEAVWGVCQVYGWLPSGHSQYALSGSFFNPGPYGGYLAMVLPLCLHHYLALRGKSWSDLDVRERMRKAGAVAVGVLILCVLPATMSRTAWLAAAVACVWVGVRHGNRQKWRDQWKRHRKTGIACVCMVAILLAGGLAGMYVLKPDSARGRIFLWRMACRAIVSEPFVQGSREFARPYAEAQAAYFAGGDYKPWEERVAGSPEYAFNEYLEGAVRLGVLPCLLLLSGVGYHWYRCQQRQEWTGVCAAQLSVLVFAFASYPFHIPGFAMAACVLALAGFVGVYAGGLLFPAVWIGVGVFGCNIRWQEKEAACRKWLDAQTFYRTGAYGTAADAYEPLEPVLSRNGRFLFEYGHALYKCQRWMEAVAVLERARDYTTDPMPCNIIGQALQARGDESGGRMKECYRQAEAYYQEAIHLLPGRIYPYYLLAKLYVTPHYLHLEKFEDMRHVVLGKNPKVMSTAVSQMREELKNMVLPESEKKK